MRSGEIDPCPVRAGTRARSTRSSSDALIACPFTRTNTRSKGPDSPPDCPWGASAASPAAAPATHNRAASTSPPRTRAGSAATLCVAFRAPARAPPGRRYGNTPRPYFS